MKIKGESDGRSALWRNGFWKRQDRLSPELRTTHTDQYLMTRQDPSYSDGMSKAFKIRNAEHSDATRIGAIYGVHVSDGAGTFEEVAPAAEEIRRRMENVKARGLPWHVAEAKGELVGFC